MERFDPHSLPPFVNDLLTCKSLANQLGFGKAIFTTLEWVLALPAALTIIDPCRLS